MVTHEELNARESYRTPIGRLIVAAKKMASYPTLKQVSQKAVRLRVTSI